MPGVPGDTAAAGVFGALLLIAAAGYAAGILAA